ncbi:hypothetical protein EET67_04635 [Pseudaminobacter arsenicus]|uniref:Uncharacterized protein n=1 Tax=Borborobacter arsenicus TaxID=1851146 RepID=A0A432V9Z1_9HYPH|nr:hypothetical protein [Pseudaminobacter arsenicus]RUM98936.1 hypothetical protein EET67_04635 [Pseudaminobacter arsenicus]
MDRAIEAARPPRRLLAALSLLCPEVAQDIERHWDEPVTSYAGHLWRATSAPASRLANEARAILRQMLGKHLSTIMIPQDAAAGLREFDRAAAIQTGLHCQLLLDRTTFDAFVLSWLGAAENRLPAFLVFSGTTMTMETIGREGPGWLDTGTDKVNLFGMGRHKLSRRSVCATGPVSINRQALEAVSQTMPGTQLADVLLKRADEMFATAADAITALNADLACEWDRLPLAKPIFIDDRFAAMVLARHLEDKDSIPSKLLADPQRRRRLEHALQLASNGPFGGFLPGGTLHFWGVRDRRVRKLVVEQDRLVEPERPHGLSIPLDRPRLRQALLDGELLPNLLLVFLVLAILPRVRAMGGPRQIGYVPLFQSVLQAALDNNSRDERELAAELAQRESGWGMRVIDEQLPVLDQLAGLPATDILPQLYRHYRQRTLGDVTRNLIVIDDNARWRRLAAQLP